MREELLIQTNERPKNYFTRAARYITSIQDGVALEDGTVLKNEMTKDEVKEYMDYLFAMMYPIIKRVVECETIAAKLPMQVADIVLSRAYLMLMEEFKNFNNFENREDSENKEYELDTFIRNRIKHCIREAIAEDRNMTVNSTRSLRKIKKSERVSQEHAVWMRREYLWTKFMRLLMEVFQRGK